MLTIPPLYLLPLRILRPAGLLLPLFLPQDTVNSLADLPGFFHFLFQRNIPLIKRFPFDGQLYYKYRFSVLRRLGVDQHEAEHLILKQLAVWFGLPIAVATFVSIIVVIYFFETISAQISAYIGIGALLAQVGVTVCILVLLLICYFISAWILFQKAVTE